MKNIIITCIVVIFLSSFLYSCKKDDITEIPITVPEITSLESGTSKNLNSVSFIDSEIGFVVGDSGTILKTTNGGTSWMSLSSGSTSNLSSVCFITQDIGYVVGARGTILKTTDGGITWNMQTSGAVTSLLSVCITSIDTGYAVGLSRTILKTTDGGTTWKQLGEYDYFDLFSAYFINSDTGIVVGGYWVGHGLGGSTIPIMYKTTDGGTNWAGVSVGLDNAIFSIFMLDTSTIYIICGNDIYNSVDGGANWLQQTQSEVGFRSIYFITESMGYAVGYLGKMVKTIDGGENWITLPKIVDEHLNSLSFPDISVAYAVGNNGTILKIKN